ncbi:hypothetical protein FOA43_001356 [Brettanomyces nanus]|uniref:Large ribosomal subunit protein uL14m n=1 Tax=Eeniella nana TaxID=13502 RepID=A0A875RTZ7_EENNA|nr:uncharacterized protein FOA43_001356 [Brettanomyces nanus]QPG74037.1 hypothetical protein FOA43_001356 [Brettanomyces nanus]
MIYLKTMLKVIDNSGAELVECIKVLRKNPKNFAKVGDKIVVVVQDAKPLSSQITGAAATNRVKRGDICRAVVVRTKAPIQRPDGSVVKFDDNACVLINQKNEPIGTRVSSVVAKELRKKSFNKIVSLAPRVLKESAISSLNVLDAYSVQSFNSMPYQKLAENLRPLFLKGLPKSRVLKQFAHLNLIANYENSAYKFNNVAKLELIFKKMNAYGHMGARKFWENNLKTVCFHNPQLAIEVQRVDCATKEEQMKCPSLLKVHFNDGQIKTIDCKSKQHQDIMKELVDLTNAEKVPEDQIPVFSYEVYEDRMGRK